MASAPSPMFGSFELDSSQTTQACATFPTAKVISTTTTPRKELHTGLLLDQDLSQDTHQFGGGEGYLYVFIWTLGLTLIVDKMVGPHPYPAPLSGSIAARPASAAKLEVKLPSRSGSAFSGSVTRPQGLQEVSLR